ncbi:fimbrial protein [Pseudomonas sp. V88_4]|uniref:fimbrial protein n=1 Tax=Pseudomonas sp. V88_4 TaxID=3044229 RepID=UPI00249EF15A|nr:fimbrial protein [Pseudomonas sp. V88_4]MDI3399276.1 fimbrial protein [Pseudomonas sp. V88_4]
MHRYVLIGLPIAIFSPMVNAGCVFSEMDIKTEIFADVTTAPIGSEVGTFTITATTTSCSFSSSITHRSSTLHLVSQPVNGDDRKCATTVPGISLANKTSFCHSNYTFAGPVLFGLPIPSNQPQTFTRTIPYVKTGKIPPGVYALNIKDPRLVEVENHGGGANGHRGVGQRYFQPGELIGTACSLTNAETLVDFGAVPATGAVKPFSIEFSNCTDQKDAANYDAAVSLRFRTENINKDGSALRNNSCIECSKDLQIALKNGDGSPVDLSKTYKLSNNKSKEIRNDGILYNFLAELQDAPGAEASPGRIDAQLVFETTVE